MSLLQLNFSFIINYYYQLISTTFIPAHINNRLNYSHNYRHGFKLTHKFELIPRILWFLYCCSQTTNTLDDNDNPFPVSLHMFFKYVHWILIHELCTSGR